MVPAAMDQPPGNIRVLILDARKGLIVDTILRFTIAVIRMRCRIHANFQAARKSSNGALLSRIT